MSVSRYPPATIVQGARPDGKVQDVPVRLDGGAAVADAGLYDRLDRMVDLLERISLQLEDLGGSPPVDDGGMI